MFYILHLATSYAEKNVCFVSLNVIFHSGHDLSPKRIFQFFSGCVCLWQLDLLESTDRLMLDVLRSATTASGERCVMITLTTMTHESSAECLASRTVYLFFILLISLFAVAADSQQSSHTYIHTHIHTYIHNNVCSALRRQYWVHVETEALEAVARRPTIG